MSPLTLLYPSVGSLSRVAKVWNRLQEKIVMAQSLNSFKNRLDKYWKGQKLYYEDYRAIIDGSHFIAYTLG
jgi:hypothetical protein